MGVGTAVPRGILARAVVVALLACLFALPAGAQSFLDSYKTGVEAAEAGDWAVVERSMRAALEGRSEEARRLPLQLHFKPYLPHYYLGLALAEQGRCPAALEALAESERQGVVQELDDEHARLQAAKTACEARLAAKAEADRRRAAVAEAVAGAAEALASIRELVPDPAAEPDLAAAWERGEPSLAARLEEAESNLSRARAILEGAPAGDPELETAADLARGTRSQLQGVRREAEIREQALAEEKARLLAHIEGLRRAGRSLLDRESGLATEVPAVRRQRAAVERELRESGAASPELSIRELRDLGSELEREIARLRGTAEPPPEPLLAAAEAWLRGDPEAVVAALAPEGGRTEGADGPGEGGEDAGPGETVEPMVLEDSRARAHGLLLRAAARFDLYHVGGGEDPALLEAARRDLRACHRADPDLVPVPRAFSPRFRAFFDEVTGGSGDPTSDQPPD